MHFENISSSLKPFLIRQLKWIRVAASFASLAVPLALVLYNAVEQERSEVAVELVHGSVMFDFQRRSDGSFDSYAESPYPAWMTKGICRHLVHSIVWIDLDNEAASDATLKSLSGCGDLELLHISNSSVSNSGLTALGTLPHLRVLTLNSQGITDKALPLLAEISSLEELEIHGAAVTDSGIGILSSAKNLRRLWLDETHVTNEGVKALRQRLPNCKIEH